VREYLPDLAPGVEVYVGASRTRGTIVRAEKGDRWVVAAGTLKMTVASGELSAVPVNGQAKRVSVEFHADMGTDDVPAFELRLIGMRHDEAVKALERQLDLASMKGLKEFSIVHGKGHGVLQEAVHEMLKVYAGVSDFGFARPEDGGTGKTIVKMK
jgi:DNA mismatch repair protein MutS2